MPINELGIAYKPSITESWWCSVIGFNSILLKSSSEATVNKLLDFLQDVQMSKYGFRLSKPADLVRKLERELSRFEASARHSSPEHKFQSDHAFNFVITAWHIVDWMWKYHETIFPEAEMRYGTSSFREFHSMVRAECPALNICYDLANGSKHFQLRSNREATVSSANARVTEDSGVVRSPIQPAIRSAIRPAIGYYEEQLFLSLPDGKFIKAISVFSESLEYWQSFLQQRAE